jgi:hypothetical protein
MRRNVSQLVGLIAVISAVNCTFSKKSGVIGGGGGGGDDAGSGVDIPPPRDTSVDLIQSEIVADMGSCVEVSSQTMGVPPDVLILLDRSQSMTEMVTGSTQSKWTQITAAINTFVPMTETTVNWGLKFFGTDRGTTCGETAGAAVAPGPMNAMAIMAAIAGQNPGSSTPTTVGLNSAVTYLQTLTDPNNKFILLATDGLPTCGAGGATADDSANAIQAVLDVKNMGIPTFVVGIATTGMGDTTLDMMAVNGGYPVVPTPPATQQYYAVANGADLITALGKITSMVGTCQFRVSPTPTDAASIDSVMANGYAGNIPQDPANGWSLVPGMGIQLNGSFCAQYTSGAITDVAVHVACIIP